MISSVLAHPRSCRHTSSPGCVAAAPTIGWFGVDGGEVGDYAGACRYSIWTRGLASENACSSARNGSYGQFCPVAMAAEIICSLDGAGRSELLYGSNAVQRPAPRRAADRQLLSKRLKELEEAGVITSVPTAQAGVVQIPAHRSGEDLRPVVMSLGGWGRWVQIKPRQRTSIRRC